ncbi:acetyltransferase [Neptunomonas japonica]|uniref:acetyltransferase n=1 Tax=Neptunomonas japonica TaxID=417574 RepID=UPI0003F76B40|nr:acetyltransferase [Neptunomonas japonica]
MSRLAVLGASGHGKVIADIAGQTGWKVIDFFDDAWPSLRRNSHWEVVGNTSQLISVLDQYDGVFVAIGNNSIRLIKLIELEQANAQIVSIVHPAAIVSVYSHIGKGSVIMPGAIINVDVSVGDGCIINTGATVDHDCMLGRGVHLSPGVHLSGNVTVSDNTWIGVGACVRQLTSIGTNAIVGAGAVVVRDVDSDKTVVGNPARILNRK